MKTPVNRRKPKPFQRDHRDLGPRRGGFYFNGEWVRPEQFANAVRNYGAKYYGRLKGANDPLVYDLARQTEEDRIAADAVGTMRKKVYANEIEVSIIFEKGPTADRAVQGMESMYPNAKTRGLQDQREEKPRTHTSVQSFLRDKAGAKE
jgi:hypothetical protein